MKDALFGAEVLCLAPKLFVWRRSSLLFGAEAPAELLDSELPLDAPNELPTEVPELAQPTDAPEQIEAPVMVESVVAEPERAEPELFVTPVDAPPAP